MRIETNTMEEIVDGQLTTSKIRNMSDTQLEEELQRLRAARVLAPKQTKRARTQVGTKASVRERIQPDVELG